jgi:tripartite-type tricarboxylate transporter receptor subunit TctC
MWRRSNGSLNRIVRILAPTFISVTILTAATDRQATAQPDGDFYRGKTINMYIGSAAGDAYDIYSRVAARNLSRFIPGNPTVVPSNMQGAGSLKATNYIFKQAAQDGTAIGMVSQSIAFEQMVGNSAVSFDARKFNWIGRLAPVTQFIVVSRRTPVKTVEDATRHEIVLAATSQRAVTGTAPRLLNRYAGTKFKMVYGYVGMPNLMMAVERGEVDGASATAQFVLHESPELIAQGEIALLVLQAKGRNRMFPNVPAMGEFGRTEEGRQILGLYGSTAELGRSFMAPPNVPDGQLRILRTAFDAMVKDPGFIAELERGKMELDPLSGSNVAKVVESTINVSREIALQVKEAVE